LVKKFSFTTFIYITHDQTIAIAMSDIIAVINHGKIEQIAAPEELYRRPATHFVASFVGENNILAGGTVVRLLDENVCEVDIGGIPMVGRIGEKLSPGDKADLFVRPEMILIQPGKQKSGILGEVTEINFDGSHSLIVVQLLESKRPVAVNVKLQHTENAPDLHVGDVVTLSWNWTAANAFRHVARQEA
jgi:spermidine/putrescine transport system ATP-binding protein